MKDDDFTVNIPVHGGMSVGVPIPKTRKKELAPRKEPRTITRKKQPYAYAKRGPDGAWRHWTAYVAEAAVKGLALAGGLALGKWLLGGIGELFSLHGLTGDIVSSVKGLFK